MLSHEQARRFYDRFGSGQDRQTFYEDRAIDDMIAHGSFPSARAVFELGCGTGRVAERLLTRYLPTYATYVGADISSTMVGLSQKRLSRFGSRITVFPTGGKTKLDMESSRFDRVLSTYVLDLLTKADIRMLLDEAYRILMPSGLLCLCGLTTGFTPLTRLVEKLWTAIHRINPALVGGCRPISLIESLQASRWRIHHHRKISSFGIPSEALVAEKIGAI